ncbi:MAG TPA: hypothetical protein VMH87_17775 [Pseudomonadales bacterium]|nr:hypothetical protein [Pseudomonadales bacterium]
MTATEAQIKERFPVWEALSEFFLDTELQPDDHERIAKILAASPYTENEIEDILMGEICPVCRPNMLSVAGEWIGFDPDWLKERAACRLGKRPKFRSFFVAIHGWMYARHWNKIKPRILEIRAKN